MTLNECILKLAVVKGKEYLHTMDEVIRLHIDYIEEKYSFTVYEEAQKLCDEFLKTIGVEDNELSLTYNYQWTLIDSTLICTISYNYMNSRIARWEYSLDIQIRDYVYCGMKIGKLISSIGFEKVVEIGGIK
ncbi:MAG: hypothetical protein ACRDBY_14140 [Cetobacterium sp.]